MTTDGLIVAVIFVKPQCNMHCTFCVTENNFTAMTFDQGVQLLESLEARGVRSVVFGGGEPFDWDEDLVALTRVAKKLGFSVQVGTNGIALPNGFEYIDSIDKYVLPIESATCDAHNKMRLYKNQHHEIIIDRLDKLSKAGKSVTLSTVITQPNMNEIDDLASYLLKYHSKSHNVSAWHLYQFLPLGRGGAKNWQDLEISESDYREICAGVKTRNLPFRIFQRTDMYHPQTVDFFWFEGDRLVSGSEAWQIA